MRPFWSFSTVGPKRPSAPMATLTAPKAPAAFRAVLDCCSSSMLPSMRAGYGMSCPDSVSQQVVNPPQLLQAMRNDSRLSSVLHALLHMAEQIDPMTSEVLAKCLG